MKESIKKILKTGQTQGSYYVCSTQRDSSYVYIVDQERRIIFTSTYDTIRRNTLIEEDWLNEVLEDFASKLARKYVEAEFPTSFLLNKRVRDCAGNWDPKVLNPSKPDSISAGDTGGGTTVSPVLNVISELQQAMMLANQESSNQLTQRANAGMTTWQLSTPLRQGRVINPDPFSDEFDAMQSGSNA